MPDEITLSPSKAAEAVAYCWTVRQPVCMWGQPGVGKSALHAQTAESFSVRRKSAAVAAGIDPDSVGFGAKDVRAVLLDPVDLRGLPTLRDGRASWAQPDFLPTEGEGSLFLDELNRAPTLVQNACFQLVLDRRLGEYELPYGWVVTAACNRESDGGGITRMPQALVNRFLHINVAPDLDDWCKWAMANTDDMGGVESAAMLVAFLRFRPSLLYAWSKDEHAYPTPRSWTFVAKAIAIKPDQVIERALVAGAVGQGAAVEFLNFARLFRNLPSIDAILLDPKGAPVPTNDNATLYAVSSALATRANTSNFDRVLTYMNRLPVEYAVFGVRDAITRDPSLQSTSGFIKWIVNHADVLR